MGRIIQRGNAVVYFHTIQSHAVRFDSFEQLFGAQLSYFCYFHNLSRILISIVVASYDKFCRYGEFLGCQTECFFCDVERYAFDFENHSSRRYGCYESFGSTFTFTHTYFGRFLGNRFIRKYSDPDLTLTLHITGNGDTRSFYLASGNPFCLQTFYTKGTEGQLIASSCETFHTTFLLSSEFRFLRL